MTSDVSSTPAPTPTPTPTTPTTTPSSPPWVPLALGAAVALALGSLAVAWQARQQAETLQGLWDKQQQQAVTEAAEALATARQAQEAARESGGKLALVEARVSEASVQRTQLDDLIQSLGRSRDENLLADIEAALRVAQQQSALTGSTDPLVSTLKQADERLARYNQPRLERVRRAVVRDLERVRALGQVDLPSLILRLDEAVRQADALPLAHRPANPSARQPAPAPKPAATPPLPGAPTSSAPWAPVWAHLQAAWAAVRTEAMQLVRLSRIDHPEAVLAAPDQLFFLRENLKLRLLNARLALLSRQFDIAQSDVRESQRIMERYFDTTSPRVTALQESLGQVAQQARLVVLPRPEETLAALASVNAGR